MGQIETQQVTVRNGASLTIRHAVPDDAEALLAFMAGVVPETEFLLNEPGEFQMTPEGEREWVRTRLECPGSVALLAIAKGEVVSCAGLDRGKRHRIAHTATLGISIRARYCGQGLGGHLMNTLIAFAEKSPVLERVQLSVLATNERAIRLYKKVGFVEEGRNVRSIRFSDGRYADDIRMARFVKPIDEASLATSGQGLRKGVAS
jgi:RimJ/RimL family protein N-acetyltransferase